ncbi:MAG: hypothetical protein ABI650_08035 [Dokdonella sp.]
MNVKFVLTGAVVAVAAIFASTGVHAEALTLGNTVVRTVDAPTRGLNMAQVERRYGAPLEKLPTAGGGKPRQPPINRWRYSGYTVYFERDRVIHSVRDGA